jgi:hypothetical protein
MTPESRVRDRMHRIGPEEEELAERAVAGDRVAFDALFDRYCARMAHVFRDLPDVEAKAKIWEALEQVFAALDCDPATPLALRAFRVAKTTQASRSVHNVRASIARARVSQHER